MVWKFGQLLDYYGWTLTYLWGVETFLSGAVGISLVRAICCVLELPWNPLVAIGGGLDKLWKGAGGTLAEAGCGEFLPGFYYGEIHLY